MATYKTYKIKKGDTLSSISKKMKISMSLIKARNPIIKDINKIQEGWNLKIPGYKEIKALKKMKEDVSPEMERRLIVKLKERKSKGLAEMIEIERRLKAAKIYRKRLKKPWKEKTPISKVSILKETIKGLPRASQIVMKNLISPAPALFKALKWWNAEVYKARIEPIVTSILTKGTPSTEELQKAVDKINKFQKMKLTPFLYFKKVKDVIEEISLR